MSKEVELKLRLPSSKARQIATHPALAGHLAEKNRLFNTYYDTPERELSQRGIALRLRRKGWAVWLMTVKGGESGEGGSGAESGEGCKGAESGEACKGAESGEGCNGAESGAGGLARRSEWEAPTQPGVFDFSIVTKPGLRAFLESRQAELQPVFTTDFTRTSWTIERAGAIVEIALDRGKITEGLAEGEARKPRHQSLCELELELLDGKTPDALFELAIELAADIPLHPEIASKAERGFVLADQSLRLPVKALASSVDAAQSPADAFRAIALTCLLQLQKNEAGAIAGDNPEYVHQARVAIRRLRSAFRLFAPALAPAFIDVYAPRWSKLAHQLGGARDWDVFLTETLAPLEEAFPGDPDLAVLRARGEAAKAKVQVSAGKALTQTQYSQLLLAFAAALFRVEPPTIALPGKKKSVLRKFAKRRLAKRGAMIEALLAEHGKMNAERRHELRIAFKKLRYALDFFAPILPRKRLEKYQASLAQIQDLLGNLNDQVTASRLIREIHLKSHPKGEPAPLTRGWIAGRTQLLLLALSSELRKFAALKQPWA